MSMSRNGGYYPPDVLRLSKRMECLYALRPCPGCRPRSPLLQAHVLEGRGPGKGVDQHQGRLLHAWPDATRPEVEPDRGEHHALVHELLDPVQQGFAFRPVRF